MYVQVRLTRKDESAKLIRICWLEKDKRIKPGAEVRLKGEDFFWTVEEVYDTVLPKSALKQDWKVGGLS